MSPSKTFSLIRLCICAASILVLPFGTSLPSAAAQDVATHSKSESVASELHTAATIFWNALDEEQQGDLSFGFEHQLRKDWQFIPMERKGLGFDQLKPNQRLLAMALIQTPLSNSGFTKSMQIMSLEQILHEMENNAPKRNPEKYHLFFFGKPSLEETWGWRIEGHHLSISFTIAEGKFIASTPAFFGTNPAEVRSGPQKGLRVLGREEDLGRKLVKSLSAQQKELAIFADKAPKDVINGPGREAAPLEPAGIAAKSMTENQRRSLMHLVGLYVNNLRPELAQQDMEKIEAAGVDNIHFAWAGKLTPGKPHYYRIQGPTFILEYDNVQNQANHAHTVWRDFTNDFGADILKEHHESQHGGGQDGNKADVGK